MDLASDNLARTAAEHQGTARRTAPDLADRSAFRLGKGGSCLPGARGARSGYAPTRHRSYGLRLGHIASAVGEGRGDGSILQVGAAAMSGSRLARTDSQG